MSYQAIAVQLTPDTLRITLNRPERRNSLDGDVIDELHRALDLAERDPQCRVVLLQGRDGVFSDGMNLTAAATETGQNGAKPQDGGAAFFDLLERFTTIPRVVVSHVDGWVRGGGVGLVAASDFVHATEHSTFALPEALWGLLPCCVLPFLIRRVGFQKAYTATLSTQTVSAREAHRIHLVDELTEQPDTVIRQLTYRLTKLEPSVIGDAKRYFRALSVLDESVGRNAVREFNRLMSAPAVQRRISNFVTHQRYPWER